MKGAVHTGWMLFWEATMKIIVLGSEFDVTRDMLMKQNIDGPACEWQARYTRVRRAAGFTLKQMERLAVDSFCPKQNKHYRQKRLRKIRHAYTNTMEYSSPKIRGPLRRLIAVLEGILSKLMGAGNTVHV